MEFIYVARGDGGLLKIGRTKNPRQRGRGLSLQVKKRGERLMQIKVCPALVAAVGAEWLLRRELQKRSPPCEGFEWFRGLCFDDVYQRAMSHVMRMRQLHRSLR